MLSTSTSISSRKGNERKAHRLAPHTQLLPSSHRAPGTAPTQGVKWPSGRKTLGVPSGMEWAVVMIYKRTNTSLEFFVGIWQRGFTPPHASHTVSIAEPPHTLSLSYHLFLWIFNIPVLEKKKKQIKLSAREKMEHEVNTKHASCLTLYCQSQDHTQLQCITMGIWVTLTHAQWVLEQTYCF